MNELPEHWQDGPMALPDQHHVTIEEMEFAREGVVYLMGGRPHPDGEPALACMVALWYQREALEEAGTVMLSALQWVDEMFELANAETGDLSSTELQLWKVVQDAIRVATGHYEKQP